LSPLLSIWTHDVYRATLAPNKSDGHYVLVGRLSTLVAILLSAATAYLALSFNNLMDYLQLLFSLSNAPLLATFLLGMFRTCATPEAGFCGFLFGTLSSIAHNFAYRTHWITYGSDMSANFYGAIVAWASCFIVTALLSVFTPAKSREELADLTAGLRRIQGIRIPKTELFLALAAIASCLFLSILFR
jgi:SSS family solute:Na+ symporter